MQSIIVLFFLISKSFSNDLSFSIKTTDDINQIIEKSSNESIPIQMVSPEEPKIIKVQTNGNFKLIYFYAGSAGTYRLVRHEKVAVFDINKNRFLEKTYLTKLEGLDKKAQPTFNIKDGKIIYHLPK